MTSKVTLRDVGRRIATGFGFVSTAAALVIPLLENVPDLTETQRRNWIYGLVAVSVVFAGLALFDRVMLSRHAGSLRGKLDVAVKGVAELEPRRHLQEVGSHLFSSGAWRVAVYVKVTTEAGGGEELRMLGVASSDKVAESTVLEHLPLVPSMFQEVFQQNLTRSAERKALQSGVFEGNVQAQDWLAWRNRILWGDPNFEAPTRGQFRARKFVWFATSDPSDGSNYVVIAESASGSGIDAKLVDDSAPHLWLLIIARSLKARQAIQPALSAAEVLAPMPGAHSRV